MAKALIAMAIVIALAFWGSPDAASDEIVVRAAILAAVFLGVLPLMYCWKLAGVPAEMHNELSLEKATTLDELTRIVTPRLELAISSEPFKRVSFGGMGESPSTGDRQTQVFQRETILRVGCKNVSGFRVDRCKALLIDVRAIDEDGNELDVGFDDSLPLSWATSTSKIIEELDLEPGTAKSIYVAAFRPAGLLLFAHEGRPLPVAYHRLFDQHEKYRLWIQINGARDAAVGICIEVEKQEGGKELTVRQVTPSPRDLRLVQPCTEGGRRL